MGYMSNGVIVGVRSCAVCGTKFNPSSRGNRYCSVKCMRRRFDAERLDFSTEDRLFTSEELQELAPEARIGLRVECANRRCKRVFVIGDREDGHLDKRTRFCCAACEKQYWRDVTRHPKAATNGTPMQKFHSAQEYASYERKTNAR